MSLAAEVCWVNRGDSTTLVGCTFNPRLPIKLFKHLIQNGEVDRRPLNHCDGGPELTARWDLAGKKVPVILQDLCEGGFCAVATDPGEAGQRLHLHLTEPEPAIIIAKTKWRLRVDNGFMVGCSLMNRRDYKRLERLQENHQPDQVVLMGG